MTSTPMPFTLIALLSLLSFLTTVSALDLSRDYEHGPVQFEDDVDLFFTIDREANTAALAIKLQDEDLVSSKSSPNWIGIGVSESTSGSMLGADVATAEFPSGAIDECKFIDRYVPFYAFPLIESTPQSPSAFPLEDDCQDDGSWELVRCERDVKTGEMILEVSRSLDAHDTQDREIGPGFQNIIYAAGTQFRYHQKKRASTRLILYQADGGTDMVAQAEPDLPDDIDEEVLVVATEYKVPPEFTTTYGCTSKRINIKKGQTKMIVASEPVLNATVDRVHHLIVYLCGGEKYADLTEKTIECGTGKTGVTNPLGDPKSKCVTLVGGYAKGAGRVVLPRNVGIFVDEGEYILAMETHFDNPQQLENIVDSSGMRIYLTNTLREHEGGTLAVGDPAVSLTGDVVESREYEFSCPSECTKKFPNPVNVYSSLLHMHTTGMEIYNNKLTPNGTFVEHFNKINFWSDSFQVITFFDPPKIINQGDHLQITCKYDTSKRPNTTFGGATTNEMCMDFLGYWPVERDPKTGQRLNICAFLKTGPTSSTNATVCGDIALLGQNESVSDVLTIQNPNVEDTFGAPTDFGDSIGTCNVPSISSAPLVSATDDPETPGTQTPTDEKPPDTTSPSETTTPPNDTSPPPDVSAINDAGTDETTPDTTSPGETDTSPNEDDNENTCFPGSATVALSDGSVKRMFEVRIGDEVLVSPNEYSRVFMFTHQTRDMVYKFVELDMEGGSSLSLTTGHFLYLNGNLTKASDAVLGDVVRLGDGSIDRIISKSMRSARGLYNPQTIHGDIVVDGVIASTYTHSVEPSLAHSLLAPLRWMYQTCGLNSSPLVIGM